MLITVTQTHIDKGIRCTGSKCALALAIKEHIADARVGTTEAFSGETEDLNYKYHVLPKEACDFRCNFDKGNMVEPFSFTLPEGILC